MNTPTGRRAVTSPIPSPVTSSLVRFLVVPAAVALAVATPGLAAAAPTGAPAAAGDVTMCKIQALREVPVYASPQDVYDEEGDGARGQAWVFDNDSQFTASDTVAADQVVYGMPKLKSFKTKSGITYGARQLGGGGWALSNAFGPPSDCTTD